MQKPITTSTRLKSRVLYHGGSYPVPSIYQKGHLSLREGRLSLKARGKGRRYPIDLDIPVAEIVSATPVEQKYYSSTAYMLIIEFSDSKNRRETVELEIRSFGRRGRARAISRLWAQTISQIKGENSP